MKFNQLSEINIYDYRKCSDRKMSVSDKTIIFLNTSQQVTRIFTTLIIINDKKSEKINAKKKMTEEEVIVDLQLMPCVSLLR